MTRQFDFVVVGRGMMGASAARHLSRAGASVALIGPGEPRDWQVHDGVFASHYDSGRITRTIDPDADWARLANRSISRYREIEAESGISFYSEAGCLVSGPAGSGYMRSVEAVARRFALDAPVLDAAGLAARFPWFSFPEGSSGVFEAKGAGVIDPRRFVAAQVACFEKTGGVSIAEEAVSVREEGDRAVVALRSGETVYCGRVLVATGGFSGAPGLLPCAPALTVKARTVVLAKLTPEQADAFRDMPSWIEESGDFYLLPPVVYPDGHTYIKLGGDPTEIVIEDAQAVRDWFRGAGDPGAVAHMTRLLLRSVPQLADAPMSSMPCVTTYTGHGHPYAGFVSGERVALLAGGNGTAAKSADEIGRIGADLLLYGRLDEPDYATDFAIRFR